MKPTICYIDETEYWIELPAKVEKIYGVYLIDKEYGIHICSLTPSYEAYVLDSVPIFSDDATQEEIEEAVEWIRSHQDWEHVNYFPYDFKFTLEYELESNDIVPKDEDERSEIMEEWLDYIRSNGEGLLFNQTI